MAFIPVQTFQTTLTALLTTSATTMRIPSAAATTLATALGSGNFTIFSISNGTANELVQCTAVSGVVCTIVRATEGTTAGTFAVGTPVRFVWTTVGIQEVASGDTSGITITGGGIVAVSGGPFAYGLTAPATALTAGTGISVTGSFPSFTVTNTAPGGGGGSTVVTGSGTAVVTSITGGYNVSVPAGAVTAGTGISISGSWPNYVITNSAPASGGSGTVTSVTAGMGITVSGSPTVTPTVAITPTGVTAGVYGALTVNAGGQITAIASNLLTSITSTTPSLTVTTPSSGVASLAQADATTSTKGIIKLAVNSSTASTDPADTTSAVSPSGLAAVIAAQSGTILGAVSSNVPLASALYTTTILTSATTLNLLSGQTAIVSATVEVMDPVNPTNIPAFAIGFFNGASFIDGNSQIPSASRTLVVNISGPFTGIVSVATTTLSGTEAVQSKSITVVAN